jgi:molybdopterin-containing oxidoreductase family membrane subunit
MTFDNQKDGLLLDPIRKTEGRFFFIVIVLSAFIGLAILAYIIQLKYGLGVTGMNRPLYWGIYITNFVFFIGISHAGTLISAILRICQAEWRRSITRAAEVITVMVLFFGVANILIDMGRPDRMLNVITHGRLQSPLLWDVCSITTYLIASSIYLYLPLIPDIAILRDNLDKRKWLHKLLALGYTGSEKQKKILELAISIMAILVIPIAVSVHTVVSFVFAMTVQPMWHSAIFGPYFVVGAIYSGIAALIIAMVLIRWIYKLDNYLKEVHFNYLGILLLVMCCLWFYFTAAEYLTTFYGAEPIHMAVFWSKFTGKFFVPFWSMVLCCFIIPIIVLANPRTRTVTGTLIASISVTIGMWLERFVIIVPTLSNPRLPIERGFYNPTWIEWSIFLGCMAAFILFYIIFTKFFPIVSIWEIQEGREHAVKHVTKRVKETLPE